MIFVDMERSKRFCGTLVVQPQLRILLQTLPLREESIDETDTDGQSRLGYACVFLPMVQPEDRVESRDRYVVHMSNLAVDSANPIVEIVVQIFEGKPAMATLSTWCRVKCGGGERIISLICPTEQDVYIILNCLVRRGFLCFVVGVKIIPSGSLEVGHNHVHLDIAVDEVWILAEVLCPWGASACGLWDAPGLFPSVSHNICSNQAGLKTYQRRHIIFDQVFSHGLVSKRDWLTIRSFARVLEFPKGILDGGRRWPELAAQQNR